MQLIAEERLRGKADRAAQWVKGREKEVKRRGELDERDTAATIGWQEPALDGLERRDDAQDR